MHLGCSPKTTLWKCVCGWTAQQGAVDFGEDNQSLMEDLEHLRIGRQ